MPSITPSTDTATLHLWSRLPDRIAYIDGVDFLTDNITNMADVLAVIVIWLLAYAAAIFARGVYRGFRRESQRLRVARQDASVRPASPEVVGRALLGAQTPKESVTVLLDADTTKLKAAIEFAKDSFVQIDGNGDVRPVGGFDETARKMRESVRRMDFEDVRPGDREVPQGDAYWRGPNGNGTTFSWWIIDDPAGGPVIDTTAREESSEKMIERYEGMRRGEE